MNIFSNVKTNNNLNCNQYAKVFGKEYSINVTYKLVKNPTLDLNKNDIQIQLPVYYKNYNVKDLVNSMMGKLYQMLAEKEPNYVLENFG